MNLRRVAAIVLLQAAISFALLEVGLRIYNPIPSRVRGSEIVLPVRHIYRFDNGLAAKKLDRYTVHTKNALGFRGPDPPRDFAQRTTVLTIGGSTTEGLFLSDGKTWTDVMARELSPQVPDLWVNNAGLDGHTTFGHLVLVQSVVARLRPRVAVFLIGANDVGLEQANTFDQGMSLQQGGLRSMANAFATRSEVASLALNLLRASRARERGLGHSEVDLNEALHLVLRPDEMAATIERHRAMLPAFSTRVERLVQLTRNAGIQPVLVTQPALFGDTIDPTTGVDLRYAQVSGRGNGELEWKLLEMVNDETRRVAATRDVPLIDLARELPKDSRFYYDFLHFTNEGSEQVGKIVSSGLLPHLLAAQNGLLAR